jgi:heme exporter protein B
LESGLLWIIIVFSATVGLGRAFISEEERGTVLMLQLNVRPSVVYAGKLLFNLLLSLFLNLIAAGTFWLVLGLELVAPGLLAVFLILGALGLAGATTLISAIIARSANKGPLFAVLSFPILIPLLLSVVRGTEEALLNGRWTAVSSELLTLIGYAGTVITASVLLFDYIWRD